MTAAATVQIPRTWDPTPIVNGLSTHQVNSHNFQVSDPDGHCVGWVMLSALHPNEGWHFDASAVGQRRGYSDTPAYPTGIKCWRDAVPTARAS